MPLAHHAGQTAALNRAAAAVTPVAEFTGTPRSFTVRSGLYSRAGSKLVLKSDFLQQVLRIHVLAEKDMVKGPAMLDDLG